MLLTWSSSETTPVTVRIRATQLQIRDGAVLYLQGVARGQVAGMSSTTSLTLPVGAKSKS